MEKISTISLPYLLLRQYLLFAFNRYYSKVIVVGKKNLLLNNDAIIFAPNHLNALMDALAILSILPKKKAVVFLARSDLFSSKFTSFIMNFAKILPAYRKIDGAENLNKNNDIFNQCIDAMSLGLGIGIMPEGGQGEEHRIRPLVKGIFRIAFEAQEQFGETKNVKIIPIGLDMDDLFKSSHHLIINIGKPINIKDFVEDYRKNPATAINTTKQILYQSLSDLTLDIASEDYYETIKFISDVEGYKFKTDNDNIYTQFLHKQRVVKNLLEKEKNQPDKMRKIDDKVKLMKDKMNKLKLSPAAFTGEEIFAIELIPGFPVFLFGFITNFLPMVIPVWIRKLIKVEYDGFYSSVQFGIGLISFPVFYGLQTILFYKFIISSILWSMGFLIFQYVSRKYALLWWKKCRKYYKKHIMKTNEQKLKDLNLFLLDNVM